MRKYPKYLSDFIIEHSSEYSIPDMAKEILHRYDIDLTVGQLRSYYKNHRLHALPRTGRKRPDQKITTPEMDSFIREHLTPDGIGLICTMGDGSVERQSDIRNAFQKQDRIHEQTGKQLKIASTFCRMVSFDTFHTELDRNGLTVLEEGITQALPDFSMLMYAVVKGEKHDL